MTSYTEIEKNLWKHRWVAAVCGGVLLAALVLVLVLKAGPAQALPCETCTGGTHQETVRATLSVNNNQPNFGKVTSSDSQIDCGRGATDCSKTYSYTVTCANDTGECTTPTYTTVNLSSSPATGYTLLDWDGECSGTGSCSVTMDSDKLVSATYADTTNPTVSLTSPATNAKVGPSLAATATASDGAGVASVQFLVDSVLKATDTSAPYSASINTTGLSDGSHTVSARATDVNGLQATSSRTVTVDLTGPTATGKPTGTRVSPTSNVTALFSEAMSRTSVEATNANGLPTTFTLRKKGTTKTLAATVVYSEPTATTFKAVLDPTRNLKAGTTYVATVSSAATDLAGNPLTKKTWKFTVKP